jgi:ribonuclease HI
LVYNLDFSSAGVSIFTDSSIHAISAAALSDNEAIWDIRELIKSLESSGTRTTLLWIPSHAGIAGNDAADRLAGDQCSIRSAPTLETHLSPYEKIAAIKKAWTQ